MPISIMPNDRDSIVTRSINSIEPPAPTNNDVQPLQFESPLAEVSELRYSSSNEKLGQFGPVRWNKDGTVRRHQGLDMRAVPGTEVFATESGIARIKKDPEGYGLYLVIEHRNGYSTLYGHLDGIGVNDGDKVDKGALLGVVGITGNASPDDPHLHFEVRKDGSPVDPLPFLPGQSTPPQVPEAVTACVKG